jgi:hypothetical protein
MFTAFCTNYILLHIPCTWLSSLSTYIQQYAIVGPRLSFWTIRKIIRSHGEEFLAPRPTPKLENHPLWAVHACLFNIYAATLHIGGRFSIRNLRKRHAVVTGAHLSPPRRTWEDNIKMDLQKVGCGAWNGSSSLRIGTCDGRLWMR